MVVVVVSVVVLKRLTSITRRRRRSVAFIAVSAALFPAWPLVAGCVASEAAVDFGPARA